MACSAADTCESFDLSSLLHFTKTGEGGFRSVGVGGSYLSNMAPTSALCALCVQSQCVITMSLHSYILIALNLLSLDTRCLCCHLLVGWSQ